VCHQPREQEERSLLTVYGNLRVKTAKRIDQFTNYYVIEREVHEFIYDYKRDYEYKTCPATPHVLQLYGTHTILFPFLGTSMQHKLMFSWVNLFYTSTVVNGKDAQLSDVVAAMKHPQTGIKLKDKRYFLKAYARCFTGMLYTPTYRQSTKSSHRCGCC
jgi:hypothetical protein